ncbi:MAG: hypothetical protein HYY86_00410 [Candidatus Harrisonbacteria bacterium]|nr:hypothetical protein [Candidatus Harrisonbacteria bacterium]
MILSYRVHFGRLKLLSGGGGVVFGEEQRLSAQSLAEAKQEFEQWKKNNADDKTIENPKLLEIREICLP